jgi:biotin carboxylase
MSYPGQVVIYSRWTAPFAEYARYEQLLDLPVSYVTTVPGARGVPTGQAVAVRTSGQLVATQGDLMLLDAALDDLARARGPVRRLIALHEGDLEMAAELRARRGLPGPGPSEVAPFRDKLEATRRVRAVGGDAPPTERVRDNEQLIAFGNRHGWPIIVKPRRGTASYGVRVLADAEQVRRRRPDETVDYIVQPFVDWPIVHVDGYFDGARAPYFKASRYLNDCLAFESLAPLGSVEIDDADTVSVLREATLAVLRALGGQRTVFHAEFFWDADSRRASFLEIGNRVGGAEIPYIWREVHGVDLVEIAFRLQAGLDLPPFPPATETRPVGEYAGWLLVPPDRKRPCTVVHADAASGTPAYAASVPGVGALIPAAGGYEVTAARFRFRGSSSERVRQAVTSVAATFAFRCEPVAMDRSTVLLIGTGGRAYREYSLGTMAGQADIVLADVVEPTWQRAFVTATVPMADRGADQLLKVIATSFPDDQRPTAVLTWDETMVEVAASVAEALHLPGIGLAAAMICRDKGQTRQALQRAGIASASFRFVDDPGELKLAAAVLGFPLVVKPRGLAGSAGVEIAHDESELAHAYATATSASYPGLGSNGVIIEEYLPGEEISADCVVVDGSILFVNVARKRLGFGVHCEEVGHLVAPWQDEPWAGPLREMLGAVHKATGVRSAVTHAELKLTPAGPRLIELNARLGGDYIPLLGQLATGVDLITAALDIACGRVPSVTATRDRCAEVQFVYPDADCRVAEVDARSCTQVPGIALAIPLASPGAELRLPPRGVVPRLAALVATGASPVATSEALRAARARLILRYEPLIEESPEATR